MVISEGIKMRITKQLVQEICTISSRAIANSTLEYSDFRIKLKMDDEYEEITDRIYKNLSRWGWIEEGGRSFIITCEGMRNLRVR